MNFQPRDLLKQYEKLDKDPLLFVHWMKKQCQARPDYAKKTFDVVKDLNPGEKDAQKEREIARKNPSNSAPSLLVKNTRPTLKSLAVISNQSTVPKHKASVDKAKVNGINSTGANNEKVGLNQHLVKLREQFTTMHDTANKKMLELQLELTKMQHMSHEFDVLAEFLSSEEKLSTFEQNLDRLQKTVLLIEDKLQSINTNNQKMINETAKMQQIKNEKAIGAIGERLESKLDRVAKRISSQKIDISEMKSNGAEYGQLKGDIESMLNGRLDDILTNMEWMKNVIFFIIALIISKTVLFDLMKKDDAIPVE